MKRLAILIIAVFALMPVATARAADPPTPGPLTSAQFVMHARGYATPVNGVANYRTTKAISAWQRQNGLKITGSLNKATLKSMGLNSTGGAIATAPAVRLTPPDPPPPPSPFAPPGLTGCAEADWYIANAGLPSGPIPGAGRGGAGGFDSQPQDGPFAERGIVFRESDCMNTAANSCCKGWLQVAASNLHASEYGPLIVASCGVVTADTLYGPSPQQKLNNVCVAKVMYDYWLAHPGQPWPWRL